MKYADVIVPLPLQGQFTYAIPDQYAERILIGCRVIVQFGKKKFYTAIVQNLYESNETKPNIKEITSVLDDSPIVLPSQLEFWEWIASYYICTMGEVYKASLPSALKLESETLVFLNPNFIAEKKLTPSEEKIFYSLSSSKPLRISEIEKIAGLTNIASHIKQLADKEAVFINEDISNKYSVKTETAIRFTENFTDTELAEIISTLKRAKKQQEILFFLLNMRNEAKSETDFHISKRELLTKTGSTSSIIDALINRNILNSYIIEISRFNHIRQNISEVKKLNPFQEKAYTEIYDNFKEKDVVLLHGVTSSGKTEIYIHLIKDALSKGKQVLYLLPEIALTTQITERLRSVFGNQLLVFHSKFNDNERAETWHTLLKADEPKVILGARSAIFLPFQQLDLIIVDEEHESSYKQQDPAPRYNARNAAIVLGSLSNAKVLLGTATPSIETYFNATQGRYGLVKLTKRHDEIELPEIVIINTKDLRKRKQMKTILSPPLISEMKTVLEKDEQVILFQNRRGFAPMLECKTCSWTPRCSHCDVSLTYHKGQRAMICHYCGAVYSVPNECPECQTPTLDVQGYGTERIEELVEENIPEANIRRMDLDTTRSKRAYEHIISDFELNKANVLIGTQMVSKGLDFGNVSLVGILNADSMLNYPDFRAYERAFQLMMQVSGRAGRKHKQGKVLLQTAHPDHPIIFFIKQHDYLSFYETQISERKLFRYPPFFRLIEIIIRGKDEKIVDSMAYEFGVALKQTFNDRVLGPTKPTVARIQSLYIRKIILKIENQASPHKVREAIETYQKYILSNSRYKSILLHYDVDPI